MSQYPGLVDIEGKCHLEGVLLSVVHSVDNLLGKNRRHQCHLIIKRVGTKQNLDYGLKHGLDFGLYYELDYGLYYRLKYGLDSQSWRGLCQGLCRFLSIFYHLHVSV